MQFYREDAYQSDENFDFSIDFEDSKYLEDINKVTKKVNDTIKEG